MVEEDQTQDPIPAEELVAGPVLGAEQQRELLRLARMAIAYYLEHGVIPDYEPRDPILQQKTGVFVTLRIPDERYDYAGEGYVTKPAGRLRGCVGHIRADRALYLSLQEAAVKAATRDPRFSPLSPAELAETHIEVSVLSPFRLVKDVRQIKVGSHGLMIVSGGYRGLLLPVVPVSRGWNLEQYLQNLCRKAGLPTNAWKKGATLYTFTAHEFGESHPMQ